MENETVILLEKYAVLQREPQTKAEKGASMVPQAVMRLFDDIIHEDQDCKRYHQIHGDVGEENEHMKMIRDRELDNPAPFSRRQVIYFNEEAYAELLNEYREKHPVDREVTIDIPIDKIIGIEDNRNLDSAKGEKVTYRELLFSYLHGCSISEDTLEYFLTNNKNGNVDKPPQKKCKNHDAKDESRMDIEMEEFYGYYIVTNGKQRVIPAMFYIFQMSEAGKSDYRFKKIRVKSSKREK